MELMKIRMQEYHWGGGGGENDKSREMGKKNKKNRVIQVCLFETKRHGTPITRRRN